MTLTPIEKKGSPHGVASQETPSSLTTLQRELGASARSSQAAAGRTSASKARTASPSRDDRGAAGRPHRGKFLGLIRSFPPAEPVSAAAAPDRSRREAHSLNCRLTDYRKHFTGQPCPPGRGREG